MNTSVDLLQYIIQFLTVRNAPDIHRRENKYNILIIFIYCNWVVTRWQWLFYMYTKHEIGYY